MGEAVDADLGSFTAAVVAGYEVMGRLGNALDVRAHYARGFHPTATCGTFAAAAVAARLLGFLAHGGGCG
jgi:2-methylcitrate dehydratase PrpD